MHAYSISRPAGHMAVRPALYRSFTPAPATAVTRTAPRRRVAAAPPPRSAAPGSPQHEQPAPAGDAAPRPDASSPSSPAAAGDAAPEHAPVLLLLAQARLAALEDFRALVSAINASPLQGGAAVDPALALAHAARFANPSLEPAAVIAEVDRLADAALCAAAEAAARAEAGAAATRAAKRGRVGFGGGGGWGSAVADGGWGADSRRRAEAALATKLMAVAAVMEAEGFASNAADPFDPDNTYIDRMLARRLGGFWGGTTVAKGTCARMPDACVWEGVSVPVPLPA